MSNYFFGGCNNFWEDSILLSWSTSGPPNLHFDRFPTNTTLTEIITQLIPEGSLWSEYAKDGNFSGPSADFVNCKILVQTKLSSESSFSTAVPFASGIFTAKFLCFQDTFSLILSVIYCKNT